MKRIAIAVALALGSTLALAEGDKTKPSAAGDAPVTTSPTPQQGQPSGSSVGDDNAGAFWTENARGGYMTKDKAMGYKSDGGQKMDFKKLDADSDGRVSQGEWTNYHEAFAQKDGGPREAEAGRSGAAGPAAPTKPSTK